MDKILEDEKNPPINASIIHGKEEVGEVELVVKYADHIYIQKMPDPKAAHDLLKGSNFKYTESFFNDDEFFVQNYAYKG